MWNLAEKVERRRVLEGVLEWDLGEIKNTLGGTVAIYDKAGRKQRRDEEGNGFIADAWVKTFFFSDTLSYYTRTP